jgi:adenylate kinase
MGRRLCEKDNNHPNNIYIEAIKPAEKNGQPECRVCGGKLSARADDQDETAINKRHNIYYDENNGTMASCIYFKNVSKENKGNPKIVEIDGKFSVKEVSENLMKKLG